MNEEKTLIVIPTYNEASIIKKIISDIKNNFKKGDILVIDAYSTDETFKIVRSCNVNIIQIDKMFGIGLAIETAILYAKKNNYDFLIRIDGDGQHPPKDVKEVLKFAILKKKDLAIGSRFLAKSDYSPNSLRLYSIKILRKLINLLYGVKITDCTSGCQILSKNLIGKVCEDENFEYSEVNIICKASILKMSIGEKFINMKDRKTGNSSFDLKNSFEYMFKNILILLSLINVKK